MNGVDESKVREYTQKPINQKAKIPTYIDGTSLLKVDLHRFLGQQRECQAIEKETQKY